jgi:acid stress-induced BolA-like protein IbaG/YrbA
MNRYKTVCIAATKYSDIVSAKASDTSQLQYQHIQWQPEYVYISKAAIHAVSLVASTYFHNYAERQCLL